MSDELDQAIGYFQRIQPHWDVLLDEIQKRRDAAFFDLKKGTEYQDSKVIGAMIAYDDVLSFLKFYEVKTSETD